MADSPSPPPGTISGRRVTVVVLIVLLVTGLLFYWVATSYATYNAARRQTDRSWRDLAAVLNERYEEYDVAVARARAEGAIDAAQQERWQSALDRFSRTTLSAEQAKAAQRLEEMIAQLPPAFRLPEIQWPKLRELSSVYASAVETQAEVGQSAGSRMLKLMLNLPAPPEFSLAESLPAEPLPVE